MSVAPARYVIELRSDHRPVGLYLHAWEDEAGGEAGTRWSGDVTRALRFSEKRHADGYIRDLVDDDAVASCIAASELVRGPHHVSEDEVDDLAAS